jgi:ubiquinone biosynthesis protein
MSLELDMSFWEIAASMVFVLGVGVVSGRILGVHRGFRRATAAGVLVVADADARGGPDTSA